MVDADAGKRDESYFVNGPIPDDLLPGLTRDFTDEEIIAVRHKVNLTSAKPEQSSPRCLWVCGPPAVGKSTITAIKCQELFGSESNAVVVDGAILRECHGGWKEVAANGFRRQPRPLIHRDAWDKLKKSKMLDSKKKQILKEAVEQRQNLCIPEAMTNLEKVLTNVKMLDDAGYEQHVVCLWAPRHVVRCRGEARQVLEGKTFTMREYVSSVKSCCELAEHFARQYPPQRCSIMTTDRFPNLFLSIFELREYARIASQTEEAADRVASSSQKMQSFRRLKHAGSKVRLANRLGRSTSSIESTISSESAGVGEASSATMEYVDKPDVELETVTLKRRVMELEAEVRSLRAELSHPKFMALASLTIASGLFIGMTSLRFLRARQTAA